MQRLLMKFLSNNKSDGRSAQLFLRIALVWSVFAVTFAAQDATSNDAEPLPPKTTLEAELAPIKATYADVFRTITQTRNLIATANANSVNKYVDESLRLKDDNLTLTLPNGFSEKDLAGAPEVANDVYYEYLNSDAGISNVKMRLSDYNRSISVSGHSREQVQALHGLLIQELEAHSTSLGGMRLRFLGAVILNISAVGLFMTGIWQKYRAAKVSCMIVAPFIYLSIWIFPWGQWFPGTAIYADSASFVVRHSAVISLAGVIVTLVTFAVGLAYSTYLTRSKPPTIDPGEQPSETQQDDHEQLNDEPDPNPNESARERNAHSD